MVIDVGTIFNAIFTGIISYYAIKTYQVTSELRERDKEHRQKTSDLYQAIVISNILSNPDATKGSIHLDDKISAFTGFYKGETLIFD